MEFETEKTVAQQQASSSTGEIDRYGKIILTFKRTKG